MVIIHELDLSYSLCFVVQRSTTFIVGVGLTGRSVTAKESALRVFYEHHLTGSSSKQGI